MRYGIFIETALGSGTAHGHWAGPVVGPGIGGPLGPVPGGDPIPTRFQRSMDGADDSADWQRLVAEALVAGGDPARCTLSGYSLSGPGQVAGGTVTWTEPPGDAVVAAVALLGPADAVLQPRQIAALLRPLP